MNLLKGKIIILTQPNPEKLRKFIENEGGICIEMPLIRIRFAEVENIDIDAFKNVNQYDWIIFTSKNGVKAFFELRLKLHDLSPISKSIKFATIGKITEEELNKHGYQSFTINDGNTSADFLKMLLPQIKNNDKIMLLLGNLAPNTLENALQLTNKVRRINVYFTEKNIDFDSNILTQITNNQYDLIVFTSPSAVNHFYNINEIKNSKMNFKTAVIGETTAIEIRKFEAEPTLIASVSTFDGVCDSILKHFKYQSFN